MDEEQAQLITVDSWIKIQWSCNLRVGYLTGIIYTSLRKIYLTDSYLNFFRIYYSTFRSPKFDPNHWRQEMAPRTIENIEEIHIIQLNGRLTNWKENKSIDIDL